MHLGLLTTMLAAVALLAGGLAILLYVHWPRIPRAWRREAVATAGLVVLLAASVAVMYAGSIEQAGVVEYPAEVNVPWYNGTFNGTKVLNATVKVPVYRSRGAGAAAVVGLAALTVAALGLVASIMIKSARGLGRL